MLPHLREERQKKVWRKTTKQAKNGPLSRYSTYYNQQVKEKKRAKNGPLLRFQLRRAKRRISRLGVVSQSSTLILWCRTAAEDLGFLKGNGSKRYECTWPPMKSAASNR